jgi:sulfopyruvate decarboxylase alpha subunit|tara:strand:- start:1965 stop:2474 length:510 start_codon:yes stop_codon:yes gene_type:complete
MDKWVKIIIDSLKEHNISVISYVPDISIDKVTKEIESDPYFKVIPASREEECIGIASGSYVSGVNSAIFMQSSGFGNCINALTSLNLPARIPIPIFINLRGEIGEFNIAQVTMGRSTKPILDVLNIPHVTLNNDINLEKKVSGNITLCYASKIPLAICISPLLHGGKIA